MPRYAVLGLTGPAWHFCLGTSGGVTALPSGPLDLDWEAMAARYARTGPTWERFGRVLDGGHGDETAREDAIAWARRHLDDGRPLIGFDFHLHEVGVVYGYDADRKGFLVDDVLTEEVGPIALWEDWPSAATGRIELFAPVEAREPDPYQTVFAALETALECFDGRDGPTDGQPRGTAGLEAWADAFDSRAEVDRAGNAYTLVVLQAARLDGAAFLAMLAESIPDAAPPLFEAERALRDMATILSPLTTLFPFPTGGHGNVRSPGLRQAAATALRRAADREREAAHAIRNALQILELADG